MTSWVPSHVELTIHQARDLLLKTKNSNSVVYVSVVAEKEKIQSPFLSPSSAPLWQYSTKIPLMSLGTSLICTVRQKTSIKDKFLGLVTIPLTSFTITSKPVTHWYKLGAKVGKTNTKLRGELLLSIRFLSNWVIEEEPCEKSLDFQFASTNGHQSKEKLNLVDKFSSVSPLSFRRKSMLKRTRSEVKSRGSDTSNDSLVGGEAEGERTASTGSSPKIKKEKSGSGRFRLSIKKKTKSPVLESCDDEFISLSLPGKNDSPLSQNEDDIFDGNITASEYLSRSLDPKYVSNGHSQRVIATGDDVNRLKEKESKESEGEKKSVVEGDNQTQADKMSPALRYHNFRRKKRPWSMHNIPVNPQFQTDEEPSPLAPDSKPFPGKDSVVQADQKQKDSQKEVVTYRAKSSLARGDAANRGGRRRVQRANTIILDSRDDSSESLSNQSTPTHSPLLGSTRALRSSDRTGDRSRSSGLGNITHSSTLPASIRRRSQSTSGPSSTGSNKNTSKSRDLPSPQHQSLNHMKSIGLGPRVPLATTLSDASRRGSGMKRPSSASPKSSPVHGGAVVPIRNASPIQLDSTLVEEDEELEDGLESVSGSTGASPVRQHMGKTVKSRVPIETESAAFKVDASELEIVLEAKPRRQSIVVASPPATKQQCSVSLPSSPSGSPARQRKLPIVPAPELESTDGAVAIAASLPSTPAHSGQRKLPELPRNLAPFSARAQSTSPITATNKTIGASSLSGRSSSTMALAEGGEQREVVGFSTLPRRHSAKNTVHLKELSKKDYEAIPALPPCLTHSQTPSQHGRSTRNQSEMDQSLSSPTGSNSKLSNGNKPIIPQEVKGLHNIRTFDPRLFNLPQSPQRQPKVSVTKPSFDETDSPETSTDASKHTPPSPKLNRSTQTRSVTPENPCSPSKSSPSESPQKLAQSFPGTPSPTTTGGGKKGGGLQAAMSRYQENRRRSKKPSPRNSFDNTAKTAGTPPMVDDSTSLSAGNSPTMQRKASTHLGHTHKSPEKGWKNPFSNLRRTQSHKAAPSNSKHQDINRSQDSTHSLDSEDQSSTSGSPSHNTITTTSHVTPDCPRLSVDNQPHISASRNSNSNNEQCGSQTIATPTSLTSDTDSIRTYGSERTLVEASGSTTVNDTSSSQPVGGLFLNLPPTRHKQTCSSVDSEGLGSLASEEVEEAGPQDWAQLSKEELVKELVHTKTKLRSTEEELKAVRGYLDNLLLRIMETSPGILSVGNL